MSKTIVINRTLSATELAEISCMTDSGAQVFAFSAGHSPEFAQSIRLSTDEKREVNYQAMEEVLQFGDITVGDQTVADLFRIDTASVWHYHKFRVYFAVRNLIYLVRPLEKQFASFDDHIWFVSPEARPLQRLFPQVDFRFPVASTKAKLNVGHLFSYLLLTKYRILNYIFRTKKQPEYLLYLTEKYSTVLNNETLQPDSGHHILEYLIGKLDNRVALLTEVLMPKPRGKSDYSYSKRQFESEWNKRSKIFLEGALISGILKSRVRKSVNAAHQQLKFAYPEVRKAELSLTQKLTLEVFRSLDKSSVFFLYRYFASREYFRKTKLKAIIAADENSPLTKSILDAARFCGIKIIGLQHGTMHDLHPAYLYTKADAKNHVMPDLTLTWGKYWEQFLTEKGNYPANSVVSVGQIRTDVIPFLLQSERQKQATATQLILFASQPQRDPELRYQAAYDIFKSARRLPNSKLIVKLHPREFADADYYRAIAKDALCTNFELDTSSDLYQLIASCDVLITCFSTVGTETVYFHKPLVILDHLNQDIMGYAAEGVAFHATNFDDLIRILSGILRGSLKIDREKYDQFIQKYAYQIDGKVAERCIQTISLVD
jgi:CDP-glycerol glycerophosphotransferase (TagB/SpsB family)